MTEIKIEDIVLYHGSLDELNSRLKRQRSKRQYRFAKELSFISGNLNINFYREEITNKLLEGGYHGLVNGRTFSRFDRIWEHWVVEGTPIVLDE